MSSIIRKSTLTFLRDLNLHNHREWFNDQRDRYQAALENMIGFADELLVEMNKHDFIETRSGKDSLMRIYRDTRFSKDKTPFKSHFGGRFRRATNKLRGGYYYHIGSDFALIAGGFFAPNAEDLRRLRKDIVLNYSEWKSMLAEKDLSEIFGSMQGHQLETAPRGFVRDHPAIDLLRYKQFYFEKRFTADEVMNESFLADVNMAFKALRPYFDFMSYVLTTDANGVSLVD